MVRHYILRDRKIVPATLMVWARWMERNRQEKVVEQTRLAGFMVSTVFLGMDHGFNPEGPPVLWESMVFDVQENGDWVSSSEWDMDRCAGSWEQAQEMHVRMVRAVAQALGIPAPRVSSQQ